MATAAGKQQELPNEVHQDAIFRETVTKEKRHQKLYTSFKFNPYDKRYSVLPEKPNVKLSDGKEDAEFLQLYRRSQDVPQNRFDYPQTEAQEIGWDNQPLVVPLRGDTRFHHPRYNSEITTYMEAAWRQKEQDQSAV